MKFISLREVGEKGDIVPHQIVINVDHIMTCVPSMWIAGTDLTFVNGKRVTVSEPIDYFVTLSIQVLPT